MRYLTTPLLLLVTTTALCQSRLSFSECAELMHNHSHAIKAAQYQTLVAKRNRQAALGLYSPHITLRAGALAMQRDLTLSTSLLGVDLSYTLQRHNPSFVEAEIAVPLFTGGKIVAANNAAKIEQAAADIALTEECDKQFLTLVERYYGYCLAQSGVEVRQKAVSSIESHLTDIEALAENGLATRAELLYARYSLSEAEAELSSARMRAETAHNALRNSVGIDSIATSSQLFDIKHIAPLDTYLSSATESNSQLEYARNRHSLAREGVALRRADFFPQITAMGGGYLGHNITTILPRWAVGVAMNFTIFDGTRREHNYLAAKQTLQLSEQIVAAAQSDITLLVESLYNTTISYQQLATSKRLSIEAAAEYLANIEAAYSEGVATFTELIDAHTTLAATHIEHLEALYNLDISLAQLLEASGMLNSFTEYEKSE